VPPLAKPAADTSSAAGSGYAMLGWLIISHRTKQLSATSQQYFSLVTNQHRPSATSRMNTLYILADSPLLAARIEKRK
jgi:hypothetical protein